MSFVHTTLAHGLALTSLAWCGRRLFPTLSVSLHTAAARALVSSPPPSLQHIAVTRTTAALTVPPPLPSPTMPSTPPAPRSRALAAVRRHAPGVAALRPPLPVCTYIYFPVCIYKHLRHIAGFCKHHFSVLEPNSGCLWGWEVFSDVVLSSSRRSIINSGCLWGWEVFSDVVLSSSRRSSIDAVENPLLLTTY